MVRELGLKIIAHRGFAGGQRRRENTMEAFADAVALGADGVETDVRLTADRRLVLVHDHQSADGQWIERLDYPRLLDVIGLAVPLLEEALSAWPGLFWNLEVKAPDAAAELARYLETSAPTGPVLVSSFWHPLVLETGWPDRVQRGVLVKHRIIGESAYLERVRSAGAGAVIWNWGLADRETVRRSADLGLDNYAYGVDSDTDFQTACEWKLTGVISDHPDRGLGLLRPGG